MLHVRRGICREMPVSEEQQEKRSCLRSRQTGELSLVIGGVGKGANT